MVLTPGDSMTDERRRMTEAERIAFENRTPAVGEVAGELWHPYEQRYVPLRGDGEHTVVELIEIITKEWDNGFNRQRNEPGEELPLPVQPEDT